MSDNIKQTATTAPIAAVETKATKATKARTKAVKATSRKVATASTPAVVRGFTFDAKTPYGGALAKDHSAFRGFTLAAAVVSGLATFNGTTFAKGSQKPYVGLFRALVGKTAARLWSSESMVDGRATVAFLNKANASVTPNSGERQTTPATVLAFVDLIRKGGKGKIPTRDRGEMDYALTVEVGSSS